MENKQTVLIFEGHDQSGKTTIAKAMSAELSIPYFKIERVDRWWDPEINVKYTTSALTDFIRQTNANVILDRWHLSDYMYGMLFKRSVDSGRIFEIDRVLAKMNASIVICYKDPEKYQADPKDSEYVAAKDYERMTDIYKTLIKWSNCKTLLLNTSDENLKGQIDRIKQHIAL